MQGRSTCTSGGPYFGELCSGVPALAVVFTGKATLIGASLSHLTFVSARNDSVARG